MRFRWSILALLLIAVTLTGCRSFQLPELFAADKNPQADVQPTPTLEPLLQKAVKDLAKRTGLRADEINVTGVVAQEFSEAAFRCEGEKERISSEQSLVTISGQTIFLEAGGRRFLYHSGDGEVIYCREVD